MILFVAGDLVGCDILFGNAVRVFVQKGTDGEADLAVFRIDVGDLRIDDLPLGEHLGGTCQLAVGDLGNVDQSVYANAPKGIIDTMVTGTTSSTLYLSVKSFHGLFSSVL